MEMLDLEDDICRSHDLSFHLVENLIWNMKFHHHAMVLKYITAPFDYDILYLNIPLPLFKGALQAEVWLWDLAHAIQKNMYLYLYFWAGWQKFCGGTGGPCRKVWTRTDILSPNIRYFVAKIVNTCLTKIFMAIFAPDKRLPRSATLVSNFTQSFIVLKLLSRV